MIWRVSLSMYKLLFKSFEVKFFTFLQDVNTFIQQQCIKLIKSGSEYFYVVTNVLFQRIYKKWCPQNITTVFNIENNKKCFLSIKSAYAHLQ